MKGHLDSDTDQSNDTKELVKQIETLKSILNQKTAQLLNVIEISDEKSADIHNQYRLMADQLHQSWKTKYEMLRKENEELMNTLTFMLNQNKLSQMQDIDSPDSSVSNLSNSDIMVVNESDNMSNLFDEYNKQSVSNDNDQYID
eukprot:183202_1